MLFRYDLLTARDGEAWTAVRLVSIQAFLLRLWANDWLHVPGPKKGELKIPSCHVVAHAFAKAFGYRAIDGEHCYYHGVKVHRDNRSMKVDFSTLLHSWVEIKTEKGNTFILDIFPDEGCSVFPVLYRGPHPGYWVPRDPERQRRLRNMRRSVFFKREVALLTEKMQIAWRKWEKQGKRKKLSE